jgi:hypothetical protein
VDVQLAAGRLDAARGAAEQLATCAARLALAHALVGERPKVAVAEAQAALEAFERLQAVRDADAAAAMLRSLGGPEPPWPRRAAGR